MRSHLSKRPAPRRGFALLITITLLSFLVLLLVSLASLTRVETQVASNNQDLAKARQNALMALNIAMGELQKYTGPDQRTTARSDMDTTLANTTTASGRWLGAYGSGAQADYDTVPSAIGQIIRAASDSKSSQAKLLNWLVSGNENTDFNPSTQVGATGNITTPPSSVQFLPTGTVAGLSASVSPLSTTLTVADKTSSPKPACLLVGPNTAGDSVADYVVAPLREISALAPGMGDTPVTVGRYGWWVGDEGAKARVNLPMANQTQAPNAFASAQRNAVELVDAVNKSSSTAVTDSTMLDPTGAASRFNPRNAKLASILSADQLPMLDPAGAAALRTVSKYRYHDLSLWSSSVLSDTYAGGLKKDLSALLSRNAASPADTDFLFTPEVNTGSTSHDMGMPTWGVLRSHVQSVAVGGIITPVVPTMTKLSTRPVPTALKMGIAPILTYANLGMAYGVPELSELPFDKPDNVIRLGFFPVVVLWNPYTTTLAGKKYEIGFRKIYDGRFELQRFNNATSVWDVIHRFDLDGNRYLRFIIEVPPIPAGQSYIFTLEKSGHNYTAADTSHPLKHGFRPGNCALEVPSSAWAASMTISTANKDYRVGCNGREGKADSLAMMTKTYYGDDIANFGRGTTGICYLADVGSPAPDNDFPYKASTFASWNWYQSISALGTSNNVAPYGPNMGYSRIQGTSGLLRPEGKIDMLTEPTFRFSFRATFGQSRNRWIAQANPRSFLITRPYSGGIINWTLSPGDNSWPNDLTVYGDPEAPRASAGISLKSSAPDPQDVSLFEVRPDNQPLLSIGQLQHANLSWLANYPSYTIGNSLGDPFLAGTPGEVSKIIPFPTGAYDLELPKKFSSYYDLSWLMNHNLWDRYFVSTVPADGTGVAGDSATTPPPDPLPNPRHVRYGNPSNAILKNADRAASGLVLDGGFNINSTSEQAWRAVLGGVNRVAYDAVSGNASSSVPEQRASLSRFSKPNTGVPATIDTTTAWSGFRQLTDIQIAQLAKNIVAEIRYRGPSISLSDFINRRLTHAPAGSGDPFPANDGLMLDDKRIKGTLQAAIDRIKDPVAPANDIPAANRPNSPAATPFVTPLVSETFAASTNIFKIGGSGNGAFKLSAPVSSVAAFAPQFLTQADVLSAIGAGLAGRSDTFAIRTYGEVTNPSLSATDTGYISGRAWCEAIVQRVPEYVDTTADPDAFKAPTGSTNKQQGRRYKVVSFRWLTPSDI